jgi:hypothetical protein
MNGTDRTADLSITSWERAAFVQESLSRLAHALQEQDAVARIAREAMFGAMGLFGIGDAALYIGDFNRETRWLLASDVPGAAPRELPEMNGFAELLRGDCRRIEVSSMSGLGMDRGHSSWCSLWDRFRSGSLTALKRGDRIEGHLWLAERLTGNPWTREEEGWLVSLAQYTAAALERSRMTVRLEQLRLDLDRKIFSF